MLEERGKKECTRVYQADSRANSVIVRYRVIGFSNSALSLGAWNSKAWMKRGGNLGETLVRAIFSGWKFVRTKVDRASAAAAPFVR